MRSSLVLFAIAANLWIGSNAYEGFQRQADEKKIAELNQKVWIYQQKVGALPDLNLIGLYDRGLTNHRLHPTPFGGYYRLNSTHAVVYNPNLPR